MFEPGRVAEPWQPGTFRVLGLMGRDFPWDWEMDTGRRFVARLPPSTACPRRIR